MVNVNIFRKTEPLDQNLEETKVFSKKNGHFLFFSIFVVDLVRNGAVMQ